MSATFRLPPSERDFEVFFAVAFESVSTRETAEFHNISQTRVRQLVTLVGDWVADHLPDFSEADLKKQVRLAQHIAANKLEDQYEAAMCCGRSNASPSTCGKPRGSPWLRPAWASSPAGCMPWRPT